MTGNSSFRMWGERGLIATFFADLHQLDDMTEVQRFLKMAGLFQEQAESHDAPEKIYFIIEPDFGKTAFGYPDAIISVEYSDRRQIIIVEAKRVNFEKSCWRSSRRGEDKFNSKLNGQLELDYRLAMAFSKFKKGDGELTEPEWVLATDYKANLKGYPRRLHISSVLEDVVSLFTGEELDQYYYLIITTDEANPLDIVDKAFLPQLFKPHLAGNSLTFPNCWVEFRKQYGWLNYDKMKQFIHRIKDRLPVESLFIPTYEINEGGFGELPDGDENNDDDNGDGGNGGPELEPPLWGVWIVKFQDKKCQLSCQNFAYALMHLQNRRWIELDRGKNDEKKMWKILSQVKVLQKAPRKNRDDISFWEKFFVDLGDC